MNIMSILLNTSVAVIGGADGPTSIAVAGDLPLPAITVSVFALAFIAYVYIRKAIDSKKAPAAVQATDTPAAATRVITAPVYTGPVLSGVEEKEAAVIMAIVSDKTGIPLEKLKFESIKLMEDK